MRKSIWAIMAISLGIMAVLSCSDRDNNLTSPELGPPAADLEAIEGSSDQAEVETAWRSCPGHPWGDHAHPWNYLIDNSFDAFYEYKLTGRGRLVGFRYLAFTAGDTATIGTSYVGWIVHAVPGQAAWDTLASVWVVRHEDRPRRLAYRYFRPIGNVDEAKLMDHAPGFFMLHIARARFYYGPEERWVRPGIDWRFEHNYVIR